jgi:hypothetical protein
MIRDYGWRGGCPATGVTDAGIGSGDWFGTFFLKTSSMFNKTVIKR